MTQILRAQSIGASARTLLETSGAEWKVLAAVRGAVYIANRDGDLIWITDQRCALHPRAVLLPAMPVRGPDTGSPVRVSPGILNCEAFTATWHPADLWRPREGSTADRPGTAFRDRGIEAIRRAAILGRRAAGSGGDGRAPRRASAAAAIARELARGRRGAAAGRDVLPVLRTTAWMVGLGEGLTPAGDDILGGYLYTMRTVSAAHCTTLDVDWDGVIAWLRSVARRTNPISGRMLVDHARGVAGALLAEFIGGALEGVQGARLARSALDVAGIGGSSGRSLLAGVGAACRVLRASHGGERPQGTRRTRGAGGCDLRREVARVR